MSGATSTERGPLLCHTTARCPPSSYVMSRSTKQIEEFTGNGGTSSLLSQYTPVLSQSSSNHGTATTSTMTVKSTATQRNQLSSNSNWNRSQNMIVVCPSSTTTQGNSSVIFKTSNKFTTNSGRPNPLECSSRNVPTNNLCQPKYKCGAVSSSEALQWGGGDAPKKNG